MEKTYNNFITNVYPTLNTYNPEHRKIADALFDNVVEEYPDPTPCRGRQKSRRPLRICVYKNFKVIEVRNTSHVCLWRLEYIPTGEIVTMDAVAYNIIWFMWWWYNRPTK